MKLNLSLQFGSKSSDHGLEFKLADEDSRIPGKLEYVLDGQTAQADCVRIAPGVYSILIGGRSYEARVTLTHSPEPGTKYQRTVTIGSRHFTIDLHDPRRRRGAGGQDGHSGPQEILAPMPGKIVKILAERNQDVAQGAGLLVIEAMKMQNELRAPRAGKIAEIYVAEGTGVETGERLLRLS